MWTTSAEWIYRIKPTKEKIVSSLFILQMKSTDTWQLGDSQIGDELTIITDGAMSFRAF